jgi:hypothetical protein
MRHIYSGIAAAALLLLIACGGDDNDDEGGSDTTESETTESGGGDDNAYVEALAASMNEEQDDITLGEEDANCVASSIVDLVGVDALEEADISPEEFAAAESFSDVDVELPEDAAAQLGQSMGECDVAGAMRPVVVEQFAAEAGAELPAEATACLEENIDNQAAADALAAAFIDGSQEGIETMVTDALLACPDVSTALILSEAGTEPTPEAQACVRSFVEGHPDLARAAFVERDQAAAEDLGVQLAGACPAAFGA